MFVAILIATKIVRCFINLSIVLMKYVMKCLGMNYSSSYLFWSHQARDLEAVVCSFWSFAGERFAAFQCGSATVHDDDVLCIEHTKVLLVNTLSQSFSGFLGFFLAQLDFEK